MILTVEELYEWFRQCKRPNTDRVNVPTAVRRAYLLRNDTKEFTIAATCRTILFKNIGSGVWEAYLRDLSAETAKG